MIIVWASLELELHLVGAALGIRRFTTSSIKWLRFADLLKKAPSPSAVLKKTQHADMDVA